MRLMISKCQPNAQSVWVGVGVGESVFSRQYDWQILSLACLFQGDANIKRQRPGKKAGGISHSEYAGHGELGF